MGAGGRAGMRIRNAGVRPPAPVVDSTIDSEGGGVSYNDHHHHHHHHHHPHMDVMDDHVVAVAMEHSVEEDAKLLPPSLQSERPSGLLSILDARRAQQHHQHPYSSSTINSNHHHHNHHLNSNQQQLGDDASPSSFYSIIGSTGAAKQLASPEPPHGGGAENHHHHHQQGQTVGSSSSMGANNQQQEDSSMLFSPCSPSSPSTSSQTSLKVMCIQIAHMSRASQCLVMTGGIFCFLLIYGFLQEYIVIHVFNRKLGIFLTLCQFIGYSTFALMHRVAHDEVPRRIPLRYYLLLATLQAAMQGLTNLSMRWLNYPAKMLFKSSRIIPTMLVGVLYMNKRYKMKDYMVVVLMSLGLVLFMQGDVKVSPSFHPLGIITISMALAVDAAIVNLQEYTLRQYDASHDELVLYSYGLGAPVLLISALISGDLYEGISFLHRSSGSITCLLVAFCTCGYLGVTCVAALTKKFGALASTMTTTARKALTLFLSFFIFPKPATPLHVVGGLLFVAGLSVKTVPSAYLAKWLARIPYFPTSSLLLPMHHTSSGGGGKHGGGGPNRKSSGDHHSGGGSKPMVI